MHRQFLIISLLSSFVMGCSSPARYTDPGGTESIVSIGEVDIQDLKKAASGMLESLLLNGVLQRAEHQPARIVIDRVVNDTSSDFPTDDLIYRMRSQLVNSGMAQVETAYKVRGKAESEVAQNELKEKAFLEGKTASDVFDPDFTLTGKITQIKRSAGRNRQSNYTFRLTLTDMATGREVWTELVDVQKSGTKSGVGF